MVERGGLNAVSGSCAFVGASLLAIPCVIRLQAGSYKTPPPEPQLFDRLEAQHEAETGLVRGTGLAAHLNPRRRAAASGL